MKLQLRSTSQEKKKEKTLGQGDSKKGIIL